MTIDEQILGMTTLVRSVSEGNEWPEYEFQGTGFFYEELVEQSVDGEVTSDDCESQWLVKGQWLITNRHVAFPKEVDDKGEEVETVPDFFEFNLRERGKSADGKASTEWHPVQLSRSELLRRTRLHPNPAVDVVAIEIQDLLISVYSNRRYKRVGPFLTINNHWLPSNNPVVIEATSDVIVCSYPFGFYDKTNKFPIIKSGIVASSWGKDFNGEPCFLVDSRLFPGSSGGLVLSKPVESAMAEEGPVPSYVQTLKKFVVLLGVFSHTYSETLQYEDGHIDNQELGLGVVWYSHLIPEIIKCGKQYAHTTI